LHLAASLSLSFQVNKNELNLSEIYHQFLEGLFNTGWVEGVAVVTGIGSVWFSKKEHILVYPIGLINTVLYVFISAKAELYGEAAVNIYYTTMSIYGWFLWARKDEINHPALHISRSDSKWLKRQLIFFLSFLISIYLSLHFLKNYFAERAIPWADAIASSSAFTAMWLMTKKKVESWWWWILTNIFSVPLYFVKGFVFTSVYYIVLLGLAIMGLISWRQKAKQAI